MTAPLLALAVAHAQLDPSGGAPLPANNQYVPTPPPPHAGGWTNVTLPASLSRKRRVVHVRHGTEIFRLDDQRVFYRSGGAYHVKVVHAVVGITHTATNLVVETIGGNVSFPPDAAVQPLKGQFTLVFYAPNERRSPYLRYTTPDLTVP